MCKDTHYQYNTKFYKEKFTEEKKDGAGVHHLDTLELTSDFSEWAALIPGTDLKNLSNRAKSKYFTDSYINPLINLESPLKDQYLKTLDCAVPLKYHEGKFYSCYCKKRFCIVCARISTAKRIKTYIPVIKDLKDPHFMTLTAPAVKNDELRARIKELIKEFQRIKDNLRKNHGIRARGTRNIEVTYNPEKDWYHPHIHCIIEGKKEAEKFVSLWLKQFPTASKKAQDIRKFGTKETDLIEAFKYSQKIISKDKNIYIQPMDIINMATAGGKDGVRLFQPYGINKPEEVELLPEEITGIKEAESFTDECTKLFIYDRVLYDWVCKTSGKPLTGFKPGKFLESFRGEKIILPGFAIPGADPGGADPGEASTPGADPGGSDPVNTRINKQRPKTGFFDDVPGFAIPGADPGGADPGEASTPGADPGGSDPVNTRINKQRPKTGFFDDVPGFAIPGADPGGSDPVNTKKRKSKRAEQMEWVVKFDQEIKRNGGKGIF